MKKHFKILKLKNENKIKPCQPRILPILSEIIPQNRRWKNQLSRKQKLKEFITNRLPLQEMSKEVLPQKEIQHGNYNLYKGLEEH